MMLDSGSGIQKYDGFSEKEKRPDAILRFFLSKLNLQRLIMVYSLVKQSEMQ